MPDPLASSSDTELRTHVERVLAAHYEVDQEIGRGGMGIVYLAKDKRLKRQVAIKLLPPELAFRSDIRSRFLREAETAAQLSHPNIVPIYSVDEREGLVYFVMAYIDGDNLAKRLHDQGMMGVDDTRRILREVADALAFAHARGVIHRDIKPDNILMTRENGRAMVTDFGIARAAQGGDSRLTATGMALGTPAYMSPEQASGERELDGRSDLYSLGIVGYQMLVGEPPFTATSTPAMLVKHLSERPVPVDARRGDIPPDLARSVMMLLEKDPAHRFPSATAFVSALDDRSAPDARVSPGAMPTFDGGPRRESSGTGQRLSAYSGDGYGSVGVATADQYMPSANERSGWDAPAVVDFRKKFRLFSVMGPVLLIVGLISDGPWLGFAAMWSVYIAWRYAKLWSDNYDWHDVFRQPRERLFFDVAAETVDDAVALFDKSKRGEVRDRWQKRSRELPSPDRSRRLTSSDGTSRSPMSPSRGLDASHSAVLRSAAADRDEIANLVKTMPRHDQELVADVIPSAQALYDRVERLTVALADLDRNAAPGAEQMIEQEISALEAQANPLDRVASEERVRRLAYLKRQRRSVRDIVQRRDQTSGKLETCRLALQQLRFDVLRLKTGGESHQRITLLAEQAMSLARDVDAVVAVEDELAGRGKRETGSGKRA